MITLRDITKTYDTRHGEVTVLDRVNLSVHPGEKLGILGRNGAGKSSLIRLIGGADRPTRGVVHRSMSVSWPLALSSGFAGSLTGHDYLRFVCRIYNVPPAGKLAFVTDFAELGPYFYEPVMTYSSGMVARLAFAVSMAIDFDCFLIDEAVAVGDSRFTAKCHEELFVKRGHKAMVMVSHLPHFIEEHCDRAAVLHQGQLLAFPDVQQAFAFYNETMGMPADVAPHVAPHLAPQLNPAAVNT